jgi:hypothetical protein
MTPDEIRRLQMSQQQRAMSASVNPQRGGQALSGGQQPRTSYRINSNVYSRYRPTRASSYRQKNLSQNDILKALSQGQDRLPYRYYLSLKFPSE